MALKFEDDKPRRKKTTKKPARARVLNTSVKTVDPKTFEEWYWKFIKDQDELGIDKDEVEIVVVVLDAWKNSHTRAATSKGSENLLWKKICKLQTKLLEYLEESVK